MTFNQSQAHETKSNINDSLNDGLFAVNAVAFPADPLTPYAGFESKPFLCTNYRTVALDIDANLDGGSSLDIQVLKRNTQDDNAWRIMPTVRGPNAAGISNSPPHTLRYRRQDYGAQDLIRVLADLLIGNVHEIKIRARVQGAGAGSVLNLKALGGKGF